MRRTTTLRFFEEYAKHCVLNLGQALQGVRYLHSHPDIDEIAPRGTLRHIGISLRFRSKRVANDLFFAAIPPHWHHTRGELEAMTPISVARWFSYGYCAWRFTESGEPKPELPPDIDKRWDPRCKAPHA
jgi:hypothetical protein